MFSQESPFVCIQLCVRLSLQDLRFCCWSVHPAPRQDDLSLALGTISPWLWQVGRISEYPAIEEMAYEDYFFGFGFDLLRIVEFVAGDGFFALHCCSR
jgi:hypothetical protein